MIGGAKPKHCCIYETVRCPTCRGVKSDERCPRCKDYGTVQAWRKHLSRKQIAEFEKALAEALMTKRMEGKP